MGGHQVIKLTLEVGGDSLATTLLLSVLVLWNLQRLSGMISETLDQHGISSILHHLDNGVIERILVLLQLSRQVVKQLVLEGFVSGLGEQRFFFKHSQQTHWFLKHVNARLQVHAKVNIGPIKSFLDIFLLFKGEHVLVEELLELLIDVVDTDLLKGVELEDLETSNIQDTNIVDLLHGRINESLITLLNNKSEGSLIDSTSNTTNRVGSSGTGGALGDPLSSDL